MAKAFGLLDHQFYQFCNDITVFLMQLGKEKEYIREKLLIWLAHLISKIVIYPVCSIQLFQVTPIVTCYKLMQLNLNF